MDYYIGFDIGGMKCAVSISKVEDNTVYIVERKEVPATKNPCETLWTLDGSVREYLK